MLKPCLTLSKKLSTTMINSSYNKLGKKYFDSGFLKLGDFDLVRISSWSDWEIDPLSNRSWQWRLNWLSFIAFFISHHHHHEILNEGKKAILSWLDRYLFCDLETKFEFAWHDHGTALRAEQLLLFTLYCIEYAPEWSEENSQFLKQANKALIRHGEKLAEESFYSKHTNHGLEQTRVLMLLALSLDCDKNQLWQSLATTRLKNELDFSFTKEGVHVENSPGYHIFVFKTFLNIIDEYPAEVLGSLAKEFNSLANQALSFITHILRPDGTLPILGDTENIRTTDAYQKYFIDAKEYQHFVYVLSQGKRGNKPEQLNKIYPESGYAIFRDQWFGSENYTQAFHVSVKAGCLSRYHHQQDEGHISVYGLGEDWLIDSGLYNYINNDPIRKYMRSRAAHNVPLISPAAYSPDFEHRLRSWRVIDWDDSLESPFVSLSINVLLPVCQKRRVSFDSKVKCLAVKDNFFSENEEPRTIILQWHIPSDKKIVVQDQTVSVSSPKGNKMRITVQGNKPDGIAVVSGVRKDRVFSVVSYKANSYESSQVVRFIFKERKSLSVTSYFNFK